jgi:hypothetical protein
VYFLVTAGVAGALTLLDLDRTFYVPPRPSERAKLYSWWWGFVILNAGIAVVIYFALRDIDPFKSMNRWLYGTIIGLGYLALIRLKFSTFNFQGKDVPFGFEAFYDAAKAFAYKRINRIAKAERDRETRKLSDETELAELARRVRLSINQDALLDIEERESAKKWLLDVLNDQASSDVEKKDSFAIYILAGVTSG